MTKIENQTMQMKTAYPWWIYLIEGSVAIVLGVMLLFVPQDALVILVQILGIYLFIKGILSLVSIFTHPGQWGWKLFVGLLGIAAGLLILNHPFTAGLAASILWVYIMAIFAIVVGLIALIQAFTGAGWPSAILGLMSIVIGILVFWQPIVVFLALPYILGLLFIAGGIMAILGALSFFYKVSEQRQRSIAEESDTRPVVIVSGEKALEPIEEKIEEAEIPVEPPMEVIDDSQVQEEEPSVIYLEEAAGGATPDEEAGESASEPGEVGWALEPEAEGDEATRSAVGGGLVTAALIAASDQEAEETEEITEPGTNVTAYEVEKVSEMLVTGDEEPGSEEDQEVEIDEILMPVGEVDEEVETDQEIEAAEQETGEIQVEAVTPGSPAQEEEMDELQRKLLDRKIDYMEGIGPVYSEKLGALGILSAYDLLQQGSTRKGRMEIAEKTGISLKLIMRWTNQADLYRVTGIGSEYAELLEAAGVDTVVELATRRPDNLHQAMITTNEEKKLVRQVPALSQVEGWVAQAKALPRIIRY
jgi:uncharacterized membrane protein HdeD (DUF308 family)/predicted flap endonuclease-1-like 5' DNA nuclease